MFAFSLFNKDNKELLLVRDRFGEKPLYYGWQGDSFVFGSQLSALRKHPNFQNTINKNALTLLLRYNYIPAPYSIYEGINKLTPGCILTFNTITNEINISKYWLKK